MISVCIATYNGEKYIKEQIDSIIKQLSDEDEIIISDDGSKDNTIEIIKKIDDKRIKIYNHTENHGFIKNFENALKYAKGDYIFLSDQDDVWMDNKVEKTMECLKNNANLVISDCITVDDNNNVIDKSRFKTFNIKKGFFRVMIKSRFLGCCMAFDKKMLEAILPFPKKYDLVEHDIWIATVGMRYFNVDLINEPLIYYKRHDNNSSDGGFSKGYPLINKINRRIYRYFEILKLRKKIKEE